MVFRCGPADTEGMDAFELTRPILSGSRRIAVAPRRAKGAPADLLATARRYVNQLPLGSWSGPAFDGPRGNPRAAAREVERTLLRVAVASGVAVGVDDSPGEIARRLVRCRVIVAPAADGALALLHLLGEEEGVGDAAKLADRLIGYLDHRAATRRF
jgi:hypothetical protein